MAIIVINLNHSGGNLSLPICKAKNQKRVLERCRDFHELHQRAKFISSSSLRGKLFQLTQKHFKRNKKALAISHFRISSLCSFWRFVSKLFHVYRTVELHLLRKWKLKINKFRSVMCSFIKKEKKNLHVPSESAFIKRLIKK